MVEVYKGKRALVRGVFREFGIAEVVVREEEL